MEKSDNLHALSSDLVHMRVPKGKSKRFSIHTHAPFVTRFTVGSQQ